MPSGSEPHLLPLHMFDELEVETVFRGFQSSPGGPVGHVEFFGRRVKTFAFFNCLEQFPSPVTEEYTAVFFKPYLESNFYGSPPP